jgi:hypothetical protein
MATDRAMARHRRHLQTPPDEFLAAKLELLGITPAALAKAPPLVVRRAAPARVHPKEGFTPAALGTVKRHTARPRPDSLERLRQLAGAPVGAPAAPAPAARRRRAAVASPDERLRPVDDAVIARLTPGTKLTKVPRAEQQMVWDAGYNLLHGHVDEHVLAQPGYAVVVGIMIDLAKNLTLFFGQDLIVEDGATVEFASYGVLYFNNVVVYGSGSIRLPENAKLHAYSIAHV